MLKSWTSEPGHMTICRDRAGTGSDPVALVSLQKRKLRHRHTQREDHMGTQERTIVHPEGREASEGTSPAHISISDLQPPGWEENTTLLLVRHSASGTVLWQPRSPENWGRLLKHSSFAHCDGNSRYYPFNIYCLCAFRLSYITSLNLRNPCGVSVTMVSSLADEGTHCRNAVSSFKAVLLMGRTRWPHPEFGL